MMLGKTAGGLYWLYRSLERAENTTRLVETGQRMDQLIEKAVAADPRHDSSEDGSDDESGS